SAFSGGADEEAFSRVVLADWPAEAGPVPDGLEALTSLLDKSLLRQELGTGGSPRFRMLETIREYAAERLAEAEPEPRTPLRHAEYYLALAEAAAAGVMGDQQRASLDALEREHDNLRAAMAFAIGENLPHMAMRLLTAMWRFWQMRGYLSEGRTIADRVLALADGSVDRELQLRALDAAGGIAYWQGDFPAARALYNEQGRVARELGDARADAEATYNASMTFALETDQEEATRLALEALEKYRALGDRRGIGLAQWAYLNSLAFREEVADGVRLAAETVDIFREVDDRFMLAWALYTQGLILTQARRMDEARDALARSLEIFRETHDISGYAIILDGYAAIEWVAGNRDEAMRIAGAASAIADVSGVGLAERNRAYAQFFPAELLREAPLAEAYAEGQKLSVEGALALVTGAAPPVEG
ncbi:MAG TPA: hypothetical protein VHK63_07795, partial [Candidatus Limnocylindria bacterium]|nr:hypothetical protein [Candidatus Limnocylindria bacterium]